jgi:polar amino acid transport system ATP-binding protein
VVIWSGALPHLEIENLCAAYGDARVLDGLSLTVDRGEVVSLIGPSGSGKSTLLRVLMGLVLPAGGTVRLDEELIDYRSRSSVRWARQRMAIVFQQFNLFQHMTVLRNVMLAPVEVQKRPPREAEEDALRVLEKVGLSDKLHAYPGELSGGQQQRVAIARSLALRPEVLLLDEATSALDPELVDEVLNTIRDLAHQGMTLLIVSHEMDFVREISDRVIMMEAGRCIEVGPSAQIFDAPHQARTREFLQKSRRVAKGAAQHRTLSTSHERAIR